MRLIPQNYFDYLPKTADVLIVHGEDLKEIASCAYLMDTRGPNGQAALRHSVRLRLPSVHNDIDDRGWAEMAGLRTVVHFGSMRTSSRGARTS